MNFSKLFGKKKKETKKASVFLKATVDIESKINEVFATTKITQKIINETKNPIEIEIFIQKNIDKKLFSSFNAKIGNSMVAKSKVIKTEKAKEKYSDSISSGNTAIYTAIDKYDKNKIIVHIGNIPPKKELTFISEFIQLTESSNNSNEYEFLRNIPTLSAPETSFNNDYIKGTLEIQTKNKIINIDKKFMLNQILVIDEEYENDDHKFIMKYEYLSINKDYIPSNKICFKLENNIEPIIFYQNSLKNKDEQSLILNYILTEKKNENIKLNPALFIFLIDQSGSMSGSPIKVASKALLLFLQSLPVGSYYQIIGFGSEYKVYDNIPKEYNQKNIEESIKIVESLKGDMGGTNIYEPLKFIYNSKNSYDKILLPRNIFLLTDGEIEDKNETLNLIEKNSNEYSIYSIGIGNYFDADLIKNAGIIGKGSYSFCRKIDGLNQVIASALNNICVPHINNFKINTSLDKLNIYKVNEISEVIVKNKIYRLYYTIKEKLGDKKININIGYKQGDEKKAEKYDIKPIELPTGEELSKLIVYNYILKNKDLSEEEKIKLALKYQIFMEGTSLFAEVELSEKITEQLEHKEIVKDTSKYPIYTDKSKGDNISSMLKGKIKEQEQRITNIEQRAMEIKDEAKEKFKAGDKAGAQRLMNKHILYIEQMKQIEGSIAMMEEQAMMLDNVSSMKDMMFQIKCGSQAIKEASKGMYVEDLENMKDDMEDIKPDQSELNDFFKDYAEEGGDNRNLLDELEEEINEEKSGELPKSSKINKIDKETVMKIINTQNFIEGFWDINDLTKMIKARYDNLFKSLKELKDKKIDDNIAMTITIIYFINKEHQELLGELVLILKKAKLYIQNKVRDSYENIIKKVGEFAPIYPNENINKKLQKEVDEDDLSQFLAV